MIGAPLFQLLLSCGLQIWFALLRWRFMTQTGIFVGPSGSRFNSVDVETLHLVAYGQFYHFCFVDLLRAAPLAPFCNI